MSHKSIFICIYWQHQVIKHSFSGLLWKLKHFCHCIQKTKQNAVLCSNYCSSSVPQQYMCWVCRVCLCACPFLSIKFANTNTHTHTWFKMVCAQSSSSMSSSSKGSRTLTSFSVNRSTNPSADRGTAELYVPVYIHTDLVCRSGNYSRVISVIGQFGKYVLSKAGYWSSGTIFIFYFFYLTRKIPMRLKTYFSRETFNEII